MKCTASWTPCLVLLFAACEVSAGEVNLPANFVRDCEYYVGNWATDVEIEGTLYRGKWIANWSPDKTCLVTHWAAETPNGPAKGTRVQGWDALTKKMLVVDFGSDGTSTIERYTITANQVSEGEISGAEPDGKPFKATARAEHKNPDYFIWTVTREGKATEYRFRRVKD